MPPPLSNRCFTLSPGLAAAISASVRSIRGTEYASVRSIRGTEYAEPTSHLAGDEDDDEEEGNDEEDVEDDDDDGDSDNDGDVDGDSGGSVQRILLGLGESRAG